MITINLNGKKQPLAAAPTLADLVELADTQRTVAVALNGVVVMRPAWSATRLSDGDTVQLIQAIGAG